MGKTVEQRRRHFRVAEHAWPFAEGEVGRDDDRGSLVEAADQMEQELASGLGKRQVTEFVQNDEVEAGQIIGQTSLASATRFKVEDAARQRADAEQRTGFDVGDVGTVLKMVEQEFRLGLAPTVLNAMRFP